MTTNKKRMRLSESQKENLLSRYNDLVSQGVGDIYSVLADDPGLLKNGIVGDRHQMRYAVNKAKGVDEEANKENDDVLQMPNLFPNMVTVLDISKEEEQVKKKIKTEAKPTVKFAVIQDEFSCTEVYDFFMDKVSPLEPEITNFILSQNIDGYTFNTYLTFQVLKDEMKLKFGNAATIMKFQKRSEEINVRSEFENHFATHDLTPIEIRSRKPIPAKDQLVRKANLTKVKRACDLPLPQKLDILCKELRGKNVYYLVKLPGQQTYEYFCMSDLIKFKEQVIVWDRTHPEFGTIYGSEKEALPQSVKISRRPRLSAPAPTLDYSMVELCQEEYDYDLL